MGKYKVKRGKDGRKGAKLKSRYQCFQGGENIVSEAGGGGRMLAQDQNIDTCSVNFDVFTVHK